MTSFKADSVYCIAGLYLKDTNIQATSSSVCNVLLPDTTDTVVTNNSSSALYNKTITSATNVIHTDAIKTTGTPVTTTGSAVPTTGQVLIATSATTAAFQSIPTISTAASLTVTPGAGVLSISTNYSLFTVVGSDAHVFIDITFTTDTSGENDSIYFNITPVACTAAFVGNTVIVSTTESILAFCTMTSANPGRVYITALYPFQNSTVYTIRGQMTVY